MPIEACESILRERSELLWRQWHPVFEDDGVPTDQVFRPNSSDHGMLSVRRAAIMTADEAMADHVRLGLKSIGTWSLTVQDVEAESLTRVVDDAACPGSPVGHAYVDFRHMKKPEAKIAAARLKAAAMKRGQVLPRQREA